MAGWLAGWLSPRMRTLWRLRLRLRGLAGPDAAHWFFGASTREAGRQAGTSARTKTTLCGLRAGFKAVVVVVAVPCQPAVTVSHAMVAVTDCDCDERRVRPRVNGTKTFLSDVVVDRWMKEDDLILDEPRAPPSPYSPIGPLFLSCPSLAPPA